MSAAGGFRAQGKVRDVFDAGPDALLLVATDRISAFDVVLPKPDPGQRPGADGLLAPTGSSTPATSCPTTCSRPTGRPSPTPFDADPIVAGRAMLVRRAQVIPVECVARGYLSGSGWAQYRREVRSAVWRCLRPRRI